MSKNPSIASFTKNRTALLIGLAAFLLTASLVISLRHAHEDSVAAAGAGYSRAPR